MTRQNLRISEIFGPTIQGEGALMGQPTIFVRAGGCDLRCQWCDTMHAVDERKYGDEWEEMKTEDVLEKIISLSKGYPMLVTLSGGNPAMQPLEELLSEGHLMEYSFALETQGTISRPWFEELDYLILSPKGPSSGMPFKADRFEQCMKMANDKPEVSIKVVVFDDADYEFAREIRKLWPHVPFYLQAKSK
jgi:7-carboxy-7-deazaguanine synthase